MLAPAEPTECAASALRKITLRLIPFLFLLYIVAWLDRVNVGFAALQMNSALQFNAAVFGFGSGVFFLGYCLFEVPSNIILDHVGARLWIARIMVSWGVISVAMMFVRTPVTFYLLRFLLGVAEAGFFPGIIYYLSGWYPTAQRARAIAAFMAAIPVTGLIGGPLSGALLGLNGVHRLAGWQQGKRTSWTCCRACGHTAVITMVHRGLVVDSSLHTACPHTACPQPDA